MTCVIKDDGKFYYKKKYDFLSKHGNNMRSKYYVRENIGLWKRIEWNQFLNIEKCIGVHKTQLNWFW